MYFIDVRHDGLGKYRRISGSDRYVVQQRADAQRRIWADQWDRHCQAESARKARENSRNQRQLEKQAVAANKDQALRETQEAEKAVTAFREILVRGAAAAKPLDWDKQYNRKPFPDRRPALPRKEIPISEPKDTDPEFVPRISFWGRIFPSVRVAQESDAAERFASARVRWRQDVEQCDAKNTLALQAHARETAAWEERKADYGRAVAIENAEIEEFRANYGRRNQEAVLGYIDLVLSQSEYPNCFPMEWEAAYRPENGVMVIDYELPAVDDMPTLKSVRYVQSRDSFERSELKESEVSNLYDDAIYQTALRTMREVFASDTVDAVLSITFNGWVNFTDKTKGTEDRACILSVQASKSEFLKINLAAVDLKACFRALKGVGSAKLAGMSAIVPILKFDKNDERFVPAREVMDDLDAGTNLAAIPWEDFEHLVREVFEREFSAGGGEVRITRASRDHGVDAIAFDPDPIRGGKIVIQAKRYTNLVGVAAVRDLYGTLINEGATKGILVTTAQYGPDSYDFAKGKPITLLNGGNLLSLLAKHGHKARIDLAEAKRLGALRDSD